MPAYLSPIGNEQQSDANGAPLAGGKIYTYQAGTTTPIATYADNAGLVPQSNPVTLNSAGLPAQPIWLPAGQAIKLVIKDAGDVVQRTVDNVLGINDPSGVSVASEWLIFSGAPTFINATSFSLGGDQTNTFQAGRRIKTANTGGTVYGTISTSAYNADTGLTTVAVVNDSGSLDSGLSQVSYSLLSASNRSIPDTYPPVGTVIHVAMNTPPAGFLKANGDVVSRATYARLFAAIGTTFGAGDGSTTFKLPDLRGEFIRGWDDARGVDSGRAFGGSQTDAMQGHWHGTVYNSSGGAGAINGITAPVSNTGGAGAAGLAGTGVQGATTDGVSGAPRTASETRPRNVALLACIKY